MLYMAMFVHDSQWLQIHFLIVLNFSSLAFAVLVQPYETKLMNALSIINELFGLLIAYFILPLQRSEYEPDSRYEMAYFAIYTMYVSAGINLAIMILVTISSLFNTIKKLY